MLKDLRNDDIGVSKCGSDSNGLLACGEIRVGTEGVIINPPRPRQTQKRKEEQIWIQGPTLLKRSWLMTTEGEKRGRRWIYMKRGGEKTLRDGGAGGGGEE